MTSSTEAPGGSRARVPDFFIVGHAKCGTTALYEMLRRHPEIFMPELKEPAFFASDVRRRVQRRAAGPLPQTL
ncbi:MAG TPA: sulfotransferase, partial [Solirubrobacteraceae bacterium]|nr:sulfotransferase [Solirubrobacteraceae bacterium]